MGGGAAAAAAAVVVVGDPTRAFLRGMRVSTCPRTSAHSRTRAGDCVAPPPAPLPHAGSPHGVTRNQQHQVDPLINTTCACLLVLTCTGKRLTLETAVVQNGDVYLPGKPPLVSPEKTATGASMARPRARA